MGKKKRRRSAKKVYDSSHRNRKEGKGIVEQISPPPSQYEYVIRHSKEIVKLIIEKGLLRRLIALMARNESIMDHLIEELKCQYKYIDLKIEERRKHAAEAMKLYLGSKKDKYNISDTFHMSSTDLKNGYVAIEEKETKSIRIFIMDHTHLLFGEPVDEYIKNEEGKLIFNPVLKDVKSLFGEGDNIVEIIVKEKNSLLELVTDKEKKWICYSATCMHRKKNSMI